MAKVNVEINRKSPHRTEGPMGIGVEKGTYIILLVQE